MRLRALVVCPGRGSYARAQLGRLPDGHPVVAALDQLRVRLGRLSISALDRAPEYTPRLHVAGEHASLLTFASTAVDLAAIDRDRIDIVGVTGNSLGFYTALYAAGALDLDGAARLIETLGHYQADNVIGGQLMYPLVDDDWRPSPAYAAAVAAALAHPGVHVSIRLGGTIVLGVDADGLAHARRVLPPIERGGMRYPTQLPSHSAFHTPLMAATGERARAELADLAMRSPATTLIGGDAVVHRPWTSPAALWSYTLGRQIVEPFDFERALATAVGELAPDVIVLPGPGDSLGGPVAQILIGRRWRGLRDRASFLAMQASDRPVMLAMARPEQRARVV
ncbi:MAG: ACP S-malonyltransferase [Deltaproteobacteria bacterium]|nr:MAG: ACP S-malonyltransferase [Deltaproteobacteria bacterium]